MPWLNGYGGGVMNYYDQVRGPLRRLPYGYDVKAIHDRWGRVKLCFLSRFTGLCLMPDKWLYETIIRHTTTPVLPEWFDNKEFRDMVKRQAVPVRGTGRQLSGFDPLWFPRTWSADEIVRRGLHKGLIKC